MCPLVCIFVFRSVLIVPINGINSFTLLILITNFAANRVYIFGKLCIFTCRALFITVKITVCDHKSDKVKLAQNLSSKGNLNLGTHMFHLFLQKPLDQWPYRYAWLYGGLLTKLMCENYWEIFSKMQDVRNLPLLPFLLIVWNADVASRVQFAILTIR